MRVEIGQIITQIISFLVMLWVLKRYAWGPLLSLLDERKAKIQNEFDSIEKEKENLDRLHKEYDEKLNDIDSLASAEKKRAIEEGKKIAQEIEKAAQKKAEAIRKQAEEDLEKEVEKSKEDLKNELVRMAVSASEKILTSSMDEDKQKKIIAKAIDQI